MNKITFLGAGSSVFAKNVLGDCLQTDCLREYEYALFDIDPVRLEESYMMLNNINRNSNGGKAKIVKYTDRLEALRGAKYVCNAIQVGGYDPCTITDFEVPKNMVCGRRLVTRMVLEVFSAHCVQSRLCRDLQLIWKRFVPTRCSSIIRIQCLC